MQTTTGKTEIWLPLTIFFVLLQSRLKQVSKTIKLSNNTNTNTLLHIQLCDCTTSCHTHSHKALFSLTWDTESLSTAAMQAQSLNLPSTPTTNPNILFPSNIYPQLSFLKQTRSLPIQISNMDPINWSFGKRPNRPFQHINSDWLSILHSISPRSYPEPAIDQRPPPRRYPTEYYVEQAAFYNAIPEGEDPFYTPPQTEIPGPLKVWVYSVLEFLVWCLNPLLLFGRNICGWVWMVVRLLPWVLWILVSGTVRAVRKVEWRWEIVVLVALAAQLVKLLPGPGLEVRGGEERDGAGGPVYTVYLAGRQAIGSGIVKGGKF